MGEGDGDGGGACGWCGGGSGGAGGEGSASGGGSGAGEEDNGLAVCDGDADLAVAIGRDGGAVAVDVGPAAVCLLRVEAVLGVGVAASVGGEDNQVAVGTAPGVSRVGDVQVDVVVSCETTGSLSGGGQFLDGLVEVGIGVEATAPQILSVSWVVTTSVSLLGTIVQDGDTTCEDDISKSVLEQSLVVLDVQPALVVVVVEEGSQGRWVREGVADSVHHVYKRLGRARLLVKVVHRVVDCVVEEAGHKLGVRGKVGWVSVKHLANVVDTGSGREARPKVLFDVLDGVDADTVEAVLVYEPVDPGVEERADLALGGVDVGESGYLTYLDTGLVVVVDVARRVV